MVVSCDNCPKKQPYYPLGDCPLCGAEGLMMDTNTHEAVCSVCGSDFGVPLAVPGKCYNDIWYSKYDVYLLGDWTKREIIDTAKALGKTAVELYQCIHNGSVMLRQMSFWDAYKIRITVKEVEIEFTSNPEFPDYEEIGKCWKTTGYLLL